MRGHPDPGGWLSPPLLLAEQGPGLGLTTTTGLRAGLAGPGQDPPGLAGLRCGQGAGAAGGGGAGTCLKPAGTVTFSLARFPVGLVIYWTWNNLLSAIQQLIVMRKNRA